MGIGTITRGAKKLYEELHFQGAKQLFQTLFREEDVDTAAGFLLDEYITDPYAVAYRDKNNQAHVRNYSPGSGTLLEPPIASEKTPMDETLSGLVESGVESTASEAAHQMKRLDRVVNMQSEAHIMTKNKQAIDVVRNGIFYAKGIQETDIGLNETFTRDAGNTLTYDFTAVGASMAEALQNVMTQFDVQGVPKEGRAVIMGSTWLTEWATDTDVQAAMETNTANILLETQINPPTFAGTEGLTIVGRYRAKGMTSPLWILSYDPGIQYKDSAGATAEPWIPAVEAIFFSFNSKTYRVYRGIKVLESAAKTKMAAGEIVFDTFVSDDPVADYLRSSTRHMFVYGNINHTAKSTGTFT